ncbi:MAG: FAD-dependent oxidoreductase [Clostridiales bacterium]|nr:FAD-dependent oxidoreductase [Clostridiales bacterium]
MIRINQLKLSPGHTDEEMKNKIKRILKLSEHDSFTYNIVKRSIDARKKPDIYYSYAVDVQVRKEQAVINRSKGNQVSLAVPVNYQFPVCGQRELKHRPVIVGTGPAGLFCGYMLALHGYKPILLERGMDVDSRKKEVDRFWEGGRLNTECNVQFGEGGAGTFSDGKLNTLVKDKDGLNKEVLSIFVKSGAQQSILYEGKPHIGTDILMQVVKNMRQAIIDNGGDVLFNTKVSDILVFDERIQAVITEAAGMETVRIDTDTLVLAIGHSARDTFDMLYRRKVPMEAKSFAVGVRVEHLQKMIDFSQYAVEEHEHLPPASYKLTAKTEEGRSVYSFCMCPGGYVVNASSEEGRLAVNGMSYSNRDGRNANSAIIVSVTPEDYESRHPLAGIAFQRMLEERAYVVGQGKVPVEYYANFKAYTKKTGNPPKIENAYSPEIKGQWQFADVHAIMPEALNKALVEGIEKFDRIIPGYAADHVLLSGIESRTSSPVRIHRDINGQSEIRGIYPCGEGAGYAGGIMSAAMDGIKIAEFIAKEYKPFEKEN